MTTSQVRDLQALRTGVGRGFATVQFCFLCSQCCVPLSLCRTRCAESGSAHQAEPSRHKPERRSRVPSSRRPCCAGRASACPRGGARRTPARPGGSRCRVEFDSGGFRLFVGDDVLLGLDRVDHASDRLAVHAQTVPGEVSMMASFSSSSIESERAEDAELGHDLSAGLDLRLQLLGVGLALARVAEHEEDQHRQDGEHDDSERIERHERRRPSGCRGERTQPTSVRAGCPQ